MRVVAAALALALSGLLAGAASAAQNDLDFVSRATDGAGGTSLSVLAAISGDGRYVAFMSDANNLSTEDDDSISNVFVRDVQTNTTTLVSRATGVAGAGGDAQSVSPSISSDGRYVVFGSDANNLSTEDNDAIRNIFVRDLQANTTTLVSRASGVAGAVGDQGSFELAISGDGRHVVFESFATNLSTANNDAVRNIYVRDLQANTTTFVSRADGPAGAGGGADSFNPVISFDGSRVAFASNADNFSTENDDGWSNIYVRDLSATTTTFVSRATGVAGAGSTASNGDPTISGDGRYVAFNTQVNNNLSDQDNDAVINVYLRDLLMSETTFVSRATGAAGAGGNGTSFSQVISADGRYIAFLSLSTNLSDADLDAVEDVFVRDLQTGTTTFVSRASGAAGAAGSGNSAFPVISDDGRYVAFESGSTNFSDQDVDAATDIFRRDVLGPTLDATPPDTVIDTGPSGPTADATPDFTFHATESGSTFKCRIGAGAFGACNGGSFTSAPLSDGAHTFEVKATDASTNEDPTPASRSFTVDTSTPPPTPEPTPSPEPTPPGPAPPDPPRVTKMTTAEQLVAGRAGVLAAQVTGSVDRLDWDLDGDGGTDVSCPGDQTTLRFRLPATKAPLRKAAFTGQVTARAVSRTGTVAAFTQTFDVAPSPTAAKKLPAPVQKIADFIEKKSPVRACGREADFEQATSELTGNRSDPLELKQVTGRWPCTDKRLIAGPKFGSLLITGCFKAIRTIEQVPVAERGWLNPLLDLAGLPKQFGRNSEAESGAIKAIEQGLDFTDAWISEEPVLVNGIKVEPQGAGKIVVFPQIDRVYSSNAAVSVGGIKLAHPPKFDLNFGYGAVSGGGSVAATWDTFNRAGGLDNVGGFPLTGNVRVVLTPGTSPSDPPGAYIDTQLQLPSSLSFLPPELGVRPPGKIKAEVTEKGELVFDDLTIAIDDANLGVASIKDLAIKFVGGTEWRGTGKLCVVEAVCLEAREIPGDTPPGGVVFRNGQLVYFFVTLGFDPGITLYPGVVLNRIGAGFELNPTTFLGNARFTAMEIFEINARVAMAFPSSAAPYKLTREKMGDAFADGLYRDYTRFTLALSADAHLRLPIIDKRIGLGSAYLLYNAPGYVAFGGGVEEDFLGILQVRGTTHGEFNFANGRFNLRGEVEFCLVDIICRGSNVIVSSVGVGGCVNVDLWIGDVNIGGGIRYPDEVILWPFDGCRWSRFHDPNVFEAQAGGAGRPHNVRIKPGDPGRAVRLEGADGAPRVRVTTPDGQVHESPEEAGVGGISAVRFLRSEELKATVVGLQDPQPGKYTIEALPGSPEITKVTEAEDPPEAQISADVRDVGASSVSDGGVREAAVSSGRRTIRYNIRRRPDQLVTFVETGPEGSRAIGTTTGGRGTLSFTPAPGRGKRKVEAQFELAGIPAERLTVATFTPPSPRLGRPTRVRVSRRGTSLRVSWPRVAGATGYDVVTTLASGDQRKTRTRRNSITIARVLRSTGGTVAVRPTATLRDGAARSARFRATARHVLKRFEPLLRFGRSR